MFLWGVHYLVKNRFCLNVASLAQQNATASLCYTSETWDREMLQDYGINCGQLQTSFRLRCLFVY